MSANRDEILTDFQACTGIDDVGEAIFHLEEANWDLLRAINRVMPQETQTLPSEMDVDVENSPNIRETTLNAFKSKSKLPDISLVADGRKGFSSCSSGSSVPISMSTDIIELPSTSRLKEIRMLEFNIHFRGRVVHLEIPDTGNVGDLKAMLAAEVNIVPCQQDLQGWKKTPKSDSTSLSSLNLPHINVLYLIVPDYTEDGELLTDESNVSAKLAQTYTLLITDETKKKLYNLKFLGSKTVLEVKADVYTLTDIPVRHQLWTGWPSTLKNDRTTLACSGINYPVHEFSLKKAPCIASKENKESRESKKNFIDLVDSDNSSVEEFEDASETFNEDDLFVDVETRRVLPLIPENSEDETTACIGFIEEFSHRFGGCHPEFFPGCLEDAIKEACNKPAKDRRLLALYLHHDGSVLTNVFCTQLLGFESVLQCLTSNFVVWGWDLTHESNRLKFLASLGRSLGGVAAMTIRSIPVERLPALVIIMKMRSATEIFTVVHGNVGVNELLTSLIQAVDVFSDQQKLEIREEEECAARELVKQQQDEAYQQSLEADRAKEQAKRNLELISNMEKQERESKLQEEAQLKEAYRLEVESTLPEEPEDGGGNDITKIRFRLPGGVIIDRRFLGNAPLKVLLDFLLVRGFPTDEYKAISGWPRKDLATLNQHSTLQELKLYPQETVIVEER